MNMLDYYKSKPNSFRVVQGKGHNSDLSLVTYVNLGIDWGQQGALDARGIVFDKEGNIVSRPYSKFFNHLELQDRKDLPDHIRELSDWQECDYIVTHKMDGSLAVVSNYKGDLLVTSSGSIDGEYPKLFKDHLECTLNYTQLKYLKALTEYITFTFEYVSPKKRIVLEYPKDAMILHGGRYTGSGEYLGYSHLVEIAKNLRLAIVPKIDLSLSDIQHDCEVLVDFEGYVVSFSNGRKLKFKTDDYLGKHRSVGFFFGNPRTKAKIAEVIDRLFSGTLDDLIYEAELRNSEGCLSVIFEVLLYNKGFNNLVEVAAELVQTHTPKEIATSEHCRVVKSIAFAVAKGVPTDELRRKYIVSKMKEV